MMTQDCLIVTCPRCRSNLRLDRKAVRTDFFVCPACLEGELAAPDVGPLAEPIPVTADEHATLKV